MSNKLAISHPVKGLVLLTINGAGKNNVAGAGLAQDLCGVCEEINFDTSVRAVIITGTEGKAFCTGLPGTSNTGAYSLSSPVAALECPVLAAINGDATGIGLELALACDIRIASAGATFPCLTSRRVCSRMTAPRSGCHGWSAGPKPWSSC